MTLRLQILIYKIKTWFSQYVFAIVRKSLENKKAKRLLQEIGRITSFLSMGSWIYPFLTANTKCQDSSGALKGNLNYFLGREANSTWQMHCLNLICFSQRHPIQKLSGYLPVTSATDEKRVMK